MPFKKNKNALSTYLSESLIKGWPPFGCDHLFCWESAANICLVDTHNILETEYSYQRKMRLFDL